MYNEDRNMGIMIANKTKLKEMEEFYTNGTINDMVKILDKLKETKVKEIQDYCDTYGQSDTLNPVVVSNYFFKSINPMTNKVPLYNAEKLGLLFDYYNFILGEINLKLGNYPPSISSFCKLAGITTSTLREYKNSSDIEMRNVVEKIYDQLGDENLTMSQLGHTKERSTIFRLETQHEMIKKNQPNINISYKQVINTDQLNENLEKYKEFLNKKGE